MVVLTSAYYSWTYRHLFTVVTTCNCQSQVPECEKICQGLQSNPRQYMQTYDNSRNTTLKEKITTLPTARKPTTTISKNSNSKKAQLPKEKKTPDETVNQTAISAPKKLAVTTVHPSATLRTTTTGPDIIGNLKDCEGCLSGRVLISVQKG